MNRVWPLRPQSIAVVVAGTAAVWLAGLSLGAYINQRIMPESLLWLPLEADIQPMPMQGSVALAQCTLLNLSHQQQVVRSIKFDPPIAVAHDKEGILTFPYVLEPGESRNIFVAIEVGRSVGRNAVIVTVSYRADEPEELAKELVQSIKYEVARSLVWVPQSVILKPDSERLTATVDVYELAAHDPLEIAEVRTSNPNAITTELVRLSQ